jgi:hypothetical protein
MFCIYMSVEMLGLSEKASVDWQQMMEERKEQRESSQINLQ